jgi:uncharacterized protein (TIGR02246 family)
MKRILSCLTVSTILIASPSWAQEKSEPTTNNEEAVVRKAVAAYVEAFNKHDAKALAAQWSPEAVYINRMTGEEVVGQNAIAEQFTAIFKEAPNLKIEVATESIQFVSPNVAVEHGTAKLIAPQGEPEQIEYTAVYVKRGGQWLLDRVTDKAPEVIASHYEHLKELEWMVGRWVDQADDARIETDCNWTKNRNFLTRSFTVTVGDRIDMSGMQIIGWDPAAKHIRSWTFDSDGGFAEANWTRKKDRWYVHNKGVLADGQTVTGVNVMKMIDQNSFTWQTTERTVGGELLPNIDEIKIVRE